MFAGEIVRYRRRRQNPHLPRDPITDRWLKRLGWYAVAVLGLCAGVLVNAQSRGPRWLATILFVCLAVALAGLGVSVIVLGWRNGMRIARLRNWV